MRGTHGRKRLFRMAQQIEQAESILLAIATLLAVADVGYASTAAGRTTGLSLIPVGGMGLLVLSRLVRLGIHHRLRDGDRDPGFRLAAEVPLFWLGISLLCTFAPTNLQQMFGADTRLSLWVRLTDALLLIMALIGGLRLCRYLAARTQNSALLLVGSFLFLIVSGTLLLRLPACRAATGNAAPESAPWNVAVFTATSAVCVTGLIVEPTGSYWSTTGHAVILTLIQLGGLGILTFGAFVAVLSSRQSWRFREASTLRELLDSDSTLSSRKLLRTILFFTLVSEAIGAVCLLGLWTEDTPVWHSVFHSVSAFCNAGFSLRDDGLLGMAGHWQVSAVMTSLIILGGLGFAVVQDLAQFVRRGRGRTGRILGAGSAVRRRLSVHSRLVLVTGALLLALGSCGFFALESLQATSGRGDGSLLLDAWFQSVTFRTAGFNTMDHESLHPASKLLAIFLMFVGAAPGSTAGGVKTVIIALIVLDLFAVLRGRDCVEVFGRSIPAHQVARALAVIGAGLTVVLTTAGLLMIFEQDPARSLDYLFEATSAFATVGVSAGITPTLTLPSRIVIIVVMFLGRIGPITLLLAMSGQSDSARYRFPEERVSLG